jgi:hypothetical protein
MTVVLSSLAWWMWVSSQRACSKRKSPLPLSCLDVEHLQRKKPRAGSADDDTGSARGHRVRHPPTHVIVHLWRCGSRSMSLE